MPTTHPSIAASALSLRACLIIASIFWLDVSLIAVVRHEMTQDVGTDAGVLETEVVALSSILMFAPLWVAAMVSRRIGYDLERWLRILLPHLVVALLFGLSAWAALRAASWFVGEPSIAEVEAQVRATGSSSELAHWRAQAVENFAHYLVLQGILTAASYYMRVRSEQALRERVARQYDRARLQALRMQTNPHFLFNTLGAIAGLIRTKPEAAEAMVTRLGDLFRAALNNRDTELVPLARELDLGVQYLEIQRERFGERFGYRMHLEADAAEVSVPPLLLQPLLENAAEYGLSSFDGRIEVEISCKREPLGVCILVRNRASAQHAPTRDSERGFGLENVRERLHAAFGDAASFAAEHGRDGFFEARVRVPFRSASEARG